MLILTLISCQFTFGQHILIGSVIDDINKYPVVGAKVTITNTNLTQITNAKGQFVFSSKILGGAHYLKITHNGYKLKVVSFEADKGNRTILSEIAVKPTRKEIKRREKEQKEKIDKKIKHDKSVKKNEKRIEKEELKKIRLASKTKNKPSKITTNVIPEEEQENEALRILKERYAKRLEVIPAEIANVKLYEFIDDWLGKPYELGGSTKLGIDCSAFTQKLFHNVYKLKIERNSVAQYRSKSTYKKHSYKNLHEGDLIFFGNTKNKISHVGIYLKNGYFVHATANIGNFGSGVKINNINTPHWKKKFIAAGTRLSQ